MFKDFGDMALGIKRFRCVSACVLDDLSASLFQQLPLEKPSGAGGGERKGGEGIISNTGSGMPCASVVCGTSRVAKAHG